MLRKGHHGATSGMQDLKIMVYEIPQDECRVRRLVYFHKLILICPRHKPIHHEWSRLNEAGEGRLPHFGGKVEEDPRLRSMSAEYSIMGGTRQRRLLYTAEKIREDLRLRSKQLETLPNEDTG